MRKKMSIMLVVAFLLTLVSFALTLPIYSSNVQPVGQGRRSEPLGLVILALEEVDMISGSAPTVDGIISSGEWDDAHLVTFATSGGTCTVYFKHDGTTLYVAFDVPNLDADSAVQIFVDTEYDQASAPQTDDYRFTIARRPPPYEYGENQGTGTGWTAWGPPVGWTGARQDLASTWNAEFAIPYAKLGITAGVAKTIGISFWNAWTPTGNYRWPTGADWLDPSTWGAAYSSDDWAHAPCLKILWDDTHDRDPGDLYTDFSMLYGNLTARGYIVAQLTETQGPINAAVLADYRILVIPDPEVALSASEITAIQNFISSGGRLWVMGEAPGFYHLPSLNTLLAPYGMEFGIADLYGNVTNMAVHPITSGISWFFYQRGSDVNVIDAAQQIAWYDAYGVLAVWDGLSRVVAIGDSDLFRDQYVQGGNLQLGLNITDWLAAPNVVFEEAHLPVFTIGSNPAYEVTGGYAEFADYLIANGYKVSTIDPGTTINSSVLAPVDVLVIVAPQSSYSTSEIDAIETWVKAGGRLLLISDYYHYGLQADTIAARFGIDLPGDMIHDTDEYVGGNTFWPYYDGANLLTHPITAGVTRVEMYASDGIASAPADEIPLIITDSDGTGTWDDGSPALNVSVMSAVDRGTAGSGRLVVITDSNIWDSAYDFDGDGDIEFYDSDNEILALNTIDWLTFVYCFDVAVTDVTPSKTVVGQGYCTTINVTVENQGTFTETFNVTTYYNATIFYDDFESGQKPQWTYYADNPDDSAVTEINDDIYKETPTHSLYIRNLYGNYWGQDNGIAYAVLNITQLPLTIPYTIEFWFYPNQNTYYLYYNGWKIFATDQDIAIMLHDDPDGILLQDESGQYPISYPSFAFQSWHKINYTRTSANSYVLQIDNYTYTGDPRGDSLSDVSTILTFGDTSPDCWKGEAYWDDILIYSGLIETKTVTNLPSGGETTITFTWNTTGVTKGNYTIKAKATPLPGETDTTDNTLTDGWVVITIPGDVDGDFDVDIYDVVLITSIYGSKQGDTLYNPNMDLWWDDVINIYDVVICTSNYGQKDP